MYPTIKLLAIATLIATSASQAQAPERALLSTSPTGYGAVHSIAPAGSTTSAAAAVFDAGARALLGRFENTLRPADSARATDMPIDGAGALMGRRSSVSSKAPAGRSTFVASLHGSTGGRVSGGAEFGTAPAGDAASGAFVISLGSRGDQSAILFSRKSGSPLGEGRYRISDGGSDADEILALIMTGSATNPTGVFRGQSGWLVVTAASDGLLTGRFSIDGVGFLAAEPEVEDRAMIATGSFSATSVN